MANPVEAITRRALAGQATNDDALYLLDILTDVAYLGSGMACNGSQGAEYMRRGDQLYDLAAGLTPPHEHDRKAPATSDATSRPTGEEGTP